MLRSWRRPAPVIAAALLHGCASAAPHTQGMMQARWTAPGGATEEVPFSFESESESQGAMFTALGKGGEHFRGRYVRVEQSTQGHLVTAVYEGFSSPEWEVWEHDSEGHWTATGVAFGDFAHFYTGRVVATLSGDHGDSMRCQFRLNEPLQGLLRGGSGPLPDLRRGAHRPPVLRPDIRDPAPGCGPMRNRPRNSPGSMGFESGRREPAERAPAGVCTPSAHSLLASHP